MKYKVVNGILVDEHGNQATPVFGDRDQIEAIKRYERSIELAQTEGLDVSVVFDEDVDEDENEFPYKAMIDCVCTDSVIIEEIGDWDEDTSALEDTHARCETCKRLYHIKETRGGQIKAILQVD